MKFEFLVIYFIKYILGLILRLAQGLQIGWDGPGAQVESLQSHGVRTPNMSYNGLLGRVDIALSGFAKKIYTAYRYLYFFMKLYHIILVWWDN